MRIEIKYKPYNFRRYSKPWIAKSKAWPTGKQPEVEWGVYVGGAFGRTGGFVEIEAEPGDIIRDGIKDHRKPHQSDNDWSVVETDGTLRKITPVEAREIWVGRDQPKKAVDGISAV
jgi:hypothetical protein